MLRGHDDYVFSAAFSLDGKRIVTASWDKTAALLGRPVPGSMSMKEVKDLLVEACVRLAGLTKLTWRKSASAGYPDSMPAIDVCR